MSNSGRRSFLPFAIRNSTFDLHKTMPKRFAKHDSPTPLEREFDALWQQMDLLTKRENRLRQGVPDIPGSTAAVPGNGGSDLRLVFFAAADPAAIIYAGP